LSGGTSTHAGGLHRVRAVGTDDDGRALGMGGLQALDVGDVVDDHRLSGRELVLTFDSELGHLDAGGAVPALPQSSIFSPGSGAITSTSGACLRSSSGVPVSAGKVP
jgi:hypothetical protein